MQPNPPQPGSPQPGSPQYGQPPVAGGPAPWGGGPHPSAAPPRARANAAAAVIAGVLALLTTGTLVWFAAYNVLHAIELTGGWSGVVVVNVIGGLLGSVLLLVPAGFTFARRIFGAWTLCVFCALSVVAIFVVAPLLWGTPFSAQLQFIFGFGGSDDSAMGLAVIFATLTAITAAIAAGAKSYGPTTAMPPRR